MTLTQDQFLSYTSQIKSTLKQFIDNLIIVEDNFAVKNVLSATFSLSFHSIIDRLENFGKKNNFRALDLILDGCIEEISRSIVYEIEKHQTLDNKFIESVNQLLKSLIPIYESKPYAFHTLHKIWFGSFWKEKYQKFILNFQKLNPYYEIFLWTDFQTISQDELNLFRKFCDTNHIKLKNIREYSDLLNYELIVEELDKSRKALFPKIHDVRASDLARVSILFKYGGIYADTDTDCIDELPLIDLPFGIILKKDGEHLFKNNELNQKIIMYDFIAANPNNKLLLLAARIQRVDYDTYHLSTLRGWEKSNQPNIHQQLTVELTGEALRWALGHLIITGNIGKENVNLLFKDLEYCLPSSYDKSWLEDLNDYIDELCNTSIPVLEDELQNATRFGKQLIEAREKFFPIKNSLVNKDANKFGSFALYDKNTDRNQQYNDCIQEGDAYYLLGEDKRAFLCYKRAISIDPKNKEAYVKAGKAIIKFDGITNEQAHAYFKGALNCPLTEAEEHGIQGICRCLAISAPYDNASYEALALLNRAIQLDPNYADAFYFRSITHLFNNNKELAIKDIDRFLVLTKFKLKGYLTRATINRADAKFIDALMDYVEALEQVPNCYTAEVRLFYVLECNIGLIIESMENMSEDNLFKLLNAIYSSNTINNRLNNSRYFLHTQKQILKDKFLYLKDKKAIIETSHNLFALANGSHSIRFFAQTPERINILIASKQAEYLSPNDGWQISKSHYHDSSQCKPSS